MSLDLLFPNFDELIRTPEDVQRLNETILQLAVQGKLVPQDPNDEPASELLKRIAGEKRRLVQEKKIRKSKQLPPIKPPEVPWDLPRGWCWSRLGDVILEIQTGPFGSMLHKSDYVEGGVPVVNPANIRDGRIVLLANMAVSEDTVKRLERYVLEQGDIVMGRRGEMGRCAVVTESEAGWLCGSGSFNLKTSHNMAQEYLVRLIRSPDARSYLSGGSVGSTMNNLNHRILNRMVIGVPPVAEQQRIVAKVDELFAQTRALEAKLRQAQERVVTFNRAALHRMHTAQDDAQFQTSWRTVSDHFDVLYDDPRNVAELRQAILDLAVRGKLAPQDPNDEPAEELLKNIGGGKRTENGRKKSLKSTLVSVRSDTLYDVPSSWAWAQFFEVANIATNSTDPGLYPDLPHIAPNNIEKFTGRLLAYRTVAEDGVSSVNHHFFAGQLLYSKIRPNLSKAVLIDFEGFCSADMYPIESLIDARYLHLYVLSSTFLSMVTRNDTRVAMPKVNQKALSKVPVAVPPLAEQQRIVAKVDQLMRLCDALEAGLAQTEASRSTLTQAVLHQITS